MSKYNFLLLLITLVSAVNSNAQTSSDLDINQFLGPAQCLSSEGLQSISVEMVNNGPSNLNGQSITLQYSTNGGATYPVSEVFIPTSLATTGSSETYTFTAQHYFLPGIITSILVRVNPQVSGDPDLADTISTKIKVITNFGADGFTGCFEDGPYLNDASVGATNWLWDFGDGNTSNLKNPVHVYSDTGTYDINLKSDDGTCFGEITRSFTVFQPVAKFSLNPAVGCAIPHTVFFTDQSILPDTWLWNFGDGNTSTAQNPVHNFTSNGSFNILLTVTDTINGCDDTIQQTVVVGGLSSNFSSSSLFGCGPLAVSFTDATVNSGSATITSWSWNFGDGGSSSLQNPTYTYQNPGVYTVTLTTTNSDGCTDTDTKINYIQVIGPDVNYGADTTQGCAPFAVNFTDSTIFGAPIVSWTWNFGDGGSSNLQNPTHIYNAIGLFNVSLIVADIDGCSRTLTEANLINTNDVTPPTISCSGINMQYLDANCETLLFDYGDEPFVSDNCGIDSVIQSPLPNTIINSNTTVIFTVYDVGLNTATCTLDVVVIDTLKPVISCPSNIAQNNDAGQCDAIVSFSPPIVTENCSGETLTQTSGLASGSLFPIGTTTNSFLVVDAQGNRDSCSFDVVITDSESPIITCPPTINQNNDIGQCGAVVIFTAPIGTDNCTGAITVQTSGLASGSLFPVGTTTNSFEVTDASGLTTSCSFDVVISDSELPTITCLSNISQNNDLGKCGSIVNYTAPIGLDNCPSQSTIQIAGLPSGSLFPVGVTTNTFEVTDAEGNSTSCSFDITISDNEAPTITCLANITRNNRVRECGAPVNYSTPIGIDNCPGSITTQLAGLPSGSQFPIGITTNTFEVIDAAGNSTTCSFDVTVIDNELPKLPCLPSVVLDNDPGQCGAIYNYIPPIGTDNCAGSVTIQTSGLPDGSMFPVGITTNTFEVTDAAGNVTTCSFNVIVNDTEIPIISCPSDIAQNNDLGQCGAVISYTAPIGTDNCPGSVTIQTTGLASGSLFPVGTTTNTFEVTDASGNLVICSFDVIITDTEFPIITCPADFDQDNDPSECGAEVVYLTPVGTDNCPNSKTKLIAGIASGDFFPIGTTTNTFEVTDASGNVTTCSFDVTVYDTELPIIVCPSNITRENDGGVCGAEVLHSIPRGKDNCPNSITTQILGFPSGSTFPIGATTNTYEVVDMSGNSTSCSFEVLVLDTDSPSIICDNNIETCDSILTVSNPIVKDNCPNTTYVLTSGIESGGHFPIGYTYNIYTATDSSGNTATCKVTIKRFEMPRINVVEDIEILAGKEERLQPESYNVYEYEWNPVEFLSDPYIRNPIASPEFSTMYKINVSSRDGCLAEDSILITVNTDFKSLEVNNFISPNDDGKNDTWIIKGHYLISSCTVQIYTSWGNLVYETTDYQNDWNGTFKDKPLPSGTYYYVVSCDGEDPKTGSITLVSSSK